MYGDLITLEKAAGLLRDATRALEELHNYAQRVRGTFIQHEGSQHDPGGPECSGGGDGRVIQPT